jgi:hypothetical protein
MTKTSKFLRIIFCLVTAVIVNTIHPQPQKTDAYNFFVVIKEKLNALDIHNPASINEVFLQRQSLNNLLETNHQIQSLHIQDPDRYNTFCNWLEKYDNRICEIAPEWNDNVLLPTLNNEEAINNPALLTQFLNIAQQFEPFLEETEQENLFSENISKIESILSGLTHNPNN